MNMILPGTLHGETIVALGTGRTTGAGRRGRERQGIGGTAKVHESEQSIVAQWDTAHDVLSQRQCCRAMVDSVPDFILY